MIGTSGADRSTNKLSIPNPSEGRHQVFDSSHLNAVLDQGCPEHRLTDEFRVCRYVDRYIQVYATKHDPGIGRRRAQGHIDLIAGV